MRELCVRWALSLQDLSSRDHTQYDCVVVALLTHGISGRLYSTDGDLIPIEDITKCIPPNLPVHIHSVPNPLQVLWWKQLPFPYWETKGVYSPGIYVYSCQCSVLVKHTIQACRGGKFDYGVESDAVDGPAPPDTDDDDKVVQ